MKSNNAEIFGIKSAGERLVWACFCTFVLVSSVVGNTIILVGSIRHNALRLNHFLVTLMEQIAVCDLVVSLVYCLPMAVSLIANSWVLGDHLGYILVYLQYIFYPAGVLFVAGLVTSKVFILWFPTATVAFLKRSKLYIVCAVWTISLYFPAAFLVVDKDDIYFDYKIYSPLYNITSDTWKHLKPAGLTLLSLLPNLAVLLSTAATLVMIVRSRRLARKSGGSVRWQGVMAVLLTAIVFSLSTLPYTVYTLIISPFVQENPPGPLKIHYKRYSAFLSLLNSMSNAYIYTYTISSYRAFLRTKLHALFRFLFPNRPSLFSSSRKGRSLFKLLSASILPTLANYKRKYR